MTENGERNFQATIPDYNYKEGPIEDKFSNCKIATDNFLTLLEPILENLVFQTNLYAIQKGNTLNLKKDELLALSCCHRNKSVYGLPQTPFMKYFSTSPDLGISLISNVMPKDRFDNILSNFHNNDNSFIPPDSKDKLDKLRPIVTKLN